MDLQNIFYHQKRVRRLLKKNKKLALFFYKTRFWCGGKTSIKKNTWKIFQYEALSETFRTIFFYFLQKRVRRLLKKIKKLAFF